MKKGILFFTISLLLTLLNPSPVRTAEFSYASAPASIVGRCPKNAVAKIYTFEAKNVSSIKDVHKTLARLLAFPTYYGENLDALDEVLRDFYDSEAVIIFWPNSSELAVQLNGEFEKMMSVFADFSGINEPGFCVILQ